MGLARGILVVLLIAILMSFCRDWESVHNITSSDVEQVRKFKDKYCKKAYTIYERDGFITLRCRKEYD